MITKKSTVLENYSVILIDIFATFFAYYLSLKLRFVIFGRNVGYTGNNVALICALLLLVSLLYGEFSYYNRDFFNRGSFVELVAITKYEVVMLLMFGTIVFLIQAKSFSRLAFVLFGILHYIITFLFHILYKKLALKFFSKSDVIEKVLIISTSDYIEKIMEEVNENIEWNYDITSIALLDISKKPGKERFFSEIPVVAGVDDLFDVATLLPIDDVFICVKDYSLKKIKEIITQFELMGITCHYNVEREELNLKGKTAGNFAGFTVMTFSLNYRDSRRALLKRAIDILGAIVGITITIVVTPIIALAIKLESKGPVIFSQERVGKNGRRFRLYKFRSMYIDAEERKEQLIKENEMKGLMFKIEDDPRVTKVGKIIRKTSIDELPQFFNILKGDMSLVGTRPPTIDEFENYDAYYRRRLSITPGLTGMWQVSGRSDIEDFDEVVKLDIQYIENWSLLLDIKIILQTIIVVLFGKGAK